MKIIPFIALFLFQLSSFAQTPTVTKATSQAWAGGVCCHSGVNYTVRISGSAHVLEKAKFTSVCIGGRLFDAVKIYVNSYTKDDITYTTLSMGHSTNQYNEIHKEEPGFQPCSTLEVIYTCGKSSMTIPIGEVEELPYLAYP